MINSGGDSVLVEFRKGWRIVVASLLGIGFGVTGLFFYSVGIFMKPLGGEFGWSRAALSSGSLVGALSLAMTAPFVGWLVDRVGARTLYFVSGLGLAGGFLLLSTSSGSLTLFLSCIALTVLLGAGASPVVFTRLINERFNRARGTALGLAQTATGLAAAILPPFLVPYVAHHGWRAGYIALACVALVSIPVVLTLLWSSHRTVSPRGLGVDGLPGLSLREAAGRREFKVLAVMFGFAAIGVGGMIVHLLPMLTDAGLTPVRAGAIAGVLGLAIIVGRAVAGFIVDRVFAPYVARAVFALAACGCGLLAWGGAPWAPVAAALAGLAMGAEVDLISYLVSRYFGMASYGAIYGWLYAVFMVGTAIGPLMAGAAFDRFHNYTYGVAALGTALAAAAVATLWLGPFPARAGVQRPQ